MSLVSVALRVWAFWCMIFGIEAALTIEEFHWQILAVLFYSVLAGVNWHWAEGAKNR